MFTGLATIIAWLLFILGSIRVGLGFLLAFGTETAVENVAVAQRYLAAATTGEAINEGMLAIFAGVALGVLAEISRTLKRQNKRAKEG